MQFVRQTRNVVRHHTQGILKHLTSTSLNKDLFYATAVRKYTSDSSEREDEMDLKTVVKRLGKFAPTSLAGSWDNVGLLIEPSPPHQVNVMLLTNDLTEAVMKEALDNKVDMILSYHPPIFSALKRLTQRTWKERIAIQCLENRIAVYSPHTSYDAVTGGVADWLVKPFHGTSKPVEKVTSSQFPTPGKTRLEVSIPETSSDILSTVSTIQGVTVLSKIRSDMDDSPAIRLGLNCTEEGLSRAVEFFNQFEGVRETVEIVQLIKPPVPNEGPGRIVALEKPITIHEAVEKVKLHLGLSFVRLALAVGATSESVVKKVAACPGSGASVLHGVCADLYLSGEMSHHEVLDANHRGVTVILCDHSNTERGFLIDHKVTLEAMFENKINVIVSETDRDPLSVV